jgi:hypothetical protein
MFRFPIPAFVGAVLLAALSLAAVRAEEVNCQGAISRIEGEKVTVKTMADEQQLLLEPATRIVINGKPGSPTELKIGQEVKCLGDKRDGKVTCTSIEVIRDPN